MKDLSEIHDCKKCHGKIVGISVDALGNTYCAYCGEKVDYKQIFEETIDRIKTKTDSATQMP